MPELAYLNGKIMPIEKAFVPIEDRGYQFGDAVYEYIAAHSGKLFRMDDHLERLEQSMRALSFPPVPRQTIVQAVTDLFAASQMERAGIYIQISRGVAPREHAFSNRKPVQIVMTAKSLPDAHPHAQNGAAVITLEDFRWSRCDIKTVQILPNTLAKQKAVDKGVYDAIFISEKGVIREATSSNVFIIKDGKAVTPPLTPNILPGITRKVIFEICKNETIPFEERSFTTPELYDADEVFLSGTVTEILPIVSIDEKPVADGKVGPLTGKLYRELRRREKGEPS